MAPSRFWGKAGMGASWALSIKRSGLTRTGLHPNLLSLGMGVHTSHRSINNRVCVSDFPTLEPRLRKRAHRLVATGQLHARSGRGDEVSPLGPGAGRVVPVEQRGT